MSRENGTPVPANNVELEEMLQERDGRLGDVLKAYIAEQREAIEAQLKNEMQLTVAEFLKGSPAPGTGVHSPAAMSGGLTQEMLNDAAWASAANSGMPVNKLAARNGLFRRDALGASLDGEPFAASVGSFLRAVWHRAEEEHADDPAAVKALQGYRQKMTSALRNAMSERVDSQGGFLVPEVLRSQILMVALENAVVRPRCRVIPMDSLRVPYPTIDDTSHASTVFGGVAGYWTEEAAALTVSQPAFARIVLEAKKLTAYTEIPNELLQDSVAALDQWFNNMFPIAIAWFEDVAFIAGSGTGQPQGFTNSPCAITGAARANGANGTITYADIAALYGRMLPVSLNSAVWLASPDVIPDLMQLITASSVAPPLWLPQYSAMGGSPGGGTDGFNYRLLGRPLIVSEKMPAHNAAGCLTFVDLGYYLLGDRQTMQISSSIHYKFANDLTAFRITERLDGRTWIQSAITPENGGNTLSPVVLIHA